MQSRRELRFTLLASNAFLANLFLPISFAIYVARNRSLGDPVALESDAELPEASSSVLLPG